VVDGLRYVLGHPYLRSIAASTGWSNLFGTMAFAIYIVFLVRTLGLSPETIGLVFGLGNAGTLAGAVLAGRIGRWIGVGPAIVGSMALSGPGVLLVAFAPVEFPLPFLVVSGLLFGFCALVYNINQVSFRQAVTPQTMQGRMNATMRFIVWGTIPLGMITGGFLGGTIGLRETIFVGGVGSLFAFVPLLIGPLRHLREMPEPLVEPGATEAAVSEPEPAR
jgi:MFS family permease